MYQLFMTALYVNLPSNLSDYCLVEKVKTLTSAYSVATRLYRPEKSENHQLNRTKMVQGGYDYGSNAYNGSYGHDENYGHGGNYGYDENYGHNENYGHDDNNGGDEGEYVDNGVYGGKGVHYRQGNGQFTQGRTQIVCDFCKGPHKQMECDEYLKGQEKARRRQEDITTARIQKMSVQEEQETKLQEMEARKIRTWNRQTLKAENTGKED